MTKNKLLNFRKFRKSKSLTASTKTNRELFKELNKRKKEIIKNQSQVYLIRKALESPFPCKKEKIFFSQELMMSVTAKEYFCFINRSTDFVDCYSDQYFEEFYYALNPVDKQIHDLQEKQIHDTTRKPNTRLQENEIHEQEFDYIWTSDDEDYYEQQEIKKKENDYIQKLKNITSGYNEKKKLLEEDYYKKTMVLSKRITKKNTLI